MLEIRPNCEFCDKDLPPQSGEAMICSYECTFCSDCVRIELNDVCPNCGGNFQPRPIRPRNEHRKGVCLANQPASTERRKLKYEKADIAANTASLRGTPPAQR